jgi:tRNA nucleotidyltransferase (CCA-adding enzyme)
MKRLREVILTHSNTDFDAFAAMVAAHKLYPEAALVLSGAVNRNVREFHNLHADEIETVDPAVVEPRFVKRLILVETTHANRLGELGPLCYQKGVEVIVFDHHRPEEKAPDFVKDDNFITSEDGSLVTLMLRIIAERAIPVTPLEATVFALGIHEDTGSLGFSTSTVRDAEALAFCMRRGANQALIERYLHNPLTKPQRDLLRTVLDTVEAEEVAGLEVLVAAVQEAEYVEGVSVVAHKVVDLTNCDAFFLLVEMEKRIFITARSRGGRLDVAEVLKPLGGGGHPAAASGIVKDVTLAQAKRRLRASVAQTARRARTAESVMSQPVRWVTTETSIDETLITCQRYGYGGLSVVEDGLLVGSVARRDLDRAVSHQLGHAPVKAVMTTESPVAHASTPLEQVAKLMSRDPLGRIPIVKDQVSGPVRVDDVIGVVTRSDLLRELHRRGESDRAPTAAGVGDRLRGLGLDEFFRHVQAVAASYRGVYLVGGFVRDLLLGERNLDIDIAVEGDGVEFARELAAKLSGRVRSHPKFQTAVVIAPGACGQERFRVDVASTRTEFYDFPAALPKVEHASIRQDLARRDFTVNAMAVSLKPEDFGVLLDYFGGMADLEKKRIRVLHNLSFIEDPTRIFRAVRYESRYGLRMDRHTLSLARSCSDMDLIGDLSSARLRDELVLLFTEPKVEFALRRMLDLGLERAVHPRLALEGETPGLIRAGDAVWKRFRLADEVPLWRLRLVWLLRELRSEEIATWAERMKFRRRDGEVLARAGVVGRRLAQRLATGMSVADLHEAAEDQPLEAVIVAMVLGAGGPVETRLGDYLTRTRFEHLTITGADLLELGFEESPRLGEVMHALRRLKLNGVLATREDELEAARRML